MRNLALTLLCTLNISAYATIYTVSNNPNRPAQYEQVNAAIAAANNGDTIYVHGSSIAYSNFTINKRLVVIGAGYNSNNQFNFPTQVALIGLFRDAGVQNANGSVITGFNVTDQIANTGTLSIENITIFRNQITTLRLYTGENFSGLCNYWTIYNNIIGTIIGSQGGVFGALGSNSPSPTNITIQNNIIRTVGFLLSNTILIDHNIFLGATNINRVYYVVFTNNIFVRSTGTIFSNESTFNTFNNNLSNLNTISIYSPTTSFASLSNIEANSIIPASNPFINASNLDTYSTAANYRIASSSPAKDAATDGTDLGIYGGAFPFPSGGAPGSGFDTSPQPPIPQVSEMSISNNTVQPGATLNVNVKARVNN